MKCYREHFLTSEFVQILMICVKNGCIVIVEPRSWSINASWAQSGVGYSSIRDDFVMIENPLCKHIAV
jgi:hypothetical protein